MPSWRRQGVATALLRPLLAFMEQHGNATATLHARSPEGHAFLNAISAM
ncbi:MAG: GNAT family N-acetyltransferase [Janthinobacterium lividum]